MPKALGPYSHAVRVGDLLFISGQAGIDPATGNIPEDFPAQARQAFQNLATVLEAADSDMQHVAKTTIFLTNAAEFPRLNELYAEFFPSNPPARSVPVVSLPRNLLISIECIATVR
jgi:2-iminobutanoate/2-iminopropanoate deaminase